ncbi:hypothetical protein [Paludisphaera sp.]|uniref:hypothetical protein n=1 Tax=Paludisphaera sp. TaxID=2017432 RepID=UPI00301BFB68
MRSLKRLVPGLLGLALAVPCVGSAYGQSDAPKHEHKGLLGRRNCTECQRARAMARDGVNVPPPPSAMKPGAPQLGHGHDHAHAHAHAAPALAVAPGSTGCVECEHDAAAMGGTIVPGSIVVSDSVVAPPGRAVVGGDHDEAVAAQFPAGRAVVGAEPAPIGAAVASQGNFTPVAGPVAAPTAPRDPSVMPSSMIPPQTAIGGDNSPARPRIITHMLDLPDLTRIGRVARANRERARRETHASISYGDANGPVTELPASMVFGKGR